MDLSEATFLQLAIQINVSVTVDKAIYIDYSTNGGVSWTIMTRIYYNRVKRNIDTPATQTIFDLPNDARTRSTRIRLWQPGSLDENDAVWRMDDFYVGGNTTAPTINAESDFTTSLPPEMWPSSAGGVTGASYCGRDGVILFNSSSSGLHHLTSTFLNLAGGRNLIQFEVKLAFQAFIIVSSGVFINCHTGNYHYKLMNLYPSKN